MNQHLSPMGVGLADSGNYLIRVQGNLSADWLEYFDDLSIVLSAPEGSRPISTVCTHDADQAALLGILTRLYTFGYSILYVEYLGAEQAS